MCTATACIANPPRLYSGCDCGKHSTVAVPGREAQRIVPVPGLGADVATNAVLLIGAVIIRIGFWGPFYYTYNEEPQNSIGKY